MPTGFIFNPSQPSFTTTTLSNPTNVAAAACDSSLPRTLAYAGGGTLTPVSDRSTSRLPSTLQLR